MHNQNPLNEGANGDEAAASAARRAYTTSGTTNNPKATASAARRARTARVAVRTTQAHNKGADRACNEGSGDNEAEASTARCAYAYASSAAALSAARRTYAASGTANDPKATASAARRTLMARAAVCAAKANRIDNGARNEGSGNNEAKASAARRAYRSATSDAEEAAAVAARRTSAALAARRTSKGGDINDGAFNEGSIEDKARASASCTYALSDEDEASALAARRERAGSAAQRTVGDGDIVDGTSNEGSDDNEATWVPQDTSTSQVPPPMTTRQGPPSKGTHTQQGRQGPLMANIPDYVAHQGTPTTPGPVPPLRCSSRTKAGGGDPGGGTPRKKPRGESPGDVVWIDRLLAEVATKPLQEDTSSEDGYIEAEAYDEGSDGDKAAASAVRRGYTASGTADDPKATAFAARHARTARAAVRTAKAKGIGNGAHNEGSGNNEAKASATRHAYAPSAASNADEAAASAARRPHAKMAAQRTVGA